MVAGVARPHILVVEDDPWVGRALQTLLRDQGYDPAVCHDGREALSYLLNHRPDAALLDIHLPDISGLDLSHRIREMHGEELPIIILSGDTAMETLRALPSAGATYFFSKPVNSSLLMDQLRELGV
jgi:DNA-binding response OmpR family regulator